MKKKRFLNAFCLCCFILFFSITGPIAQGDMLAETGAGPLVSQDEATGGAIRMNTPAAGTEERVLGDTGKQGLGGSSGSQPVYLPDEASKEVAGANVAGALFDEGVLGDTGKSGLGGDTGGKPLVLPGQDTADIATASEANFHVRTIEALKTLIESTSN